MKEFGVGQSHEGDHVVEMNAFAPEQLAVRPKGMGEHAVEHPASPREGIGELVEHLEAKNDL